MSAGWAFNPRATPWRRVEKVSDRVWLIVEDDRFNEHPFIYVILGASKIVLVDSGVGTVERSTRRCFGDWLFNWMGETLGKDAAALPLLVVNTHVHFDHVAGNSGLASRSSDICASSNDRAFTVAALDPKRDA